MIVLNNYILNIVDSFNNYYDNLSESNRLIFYIIIILLFIAAMIILIMFDQKKVHVKVLEKNKPENFGNSLDKDLFEGEPSPNYDEENENTRNLKEITQKIQDVIEGRNIELTSFEQAQEENSIISYDELLRATNQNKTQQSNQPDEMFKLARKIEADEVIKKEPPIEIRTEKFKNSDFISPIYGVQTNEIDNNINESKRIQKQQEEIEYLFPNYGINANDEEETKIKSNEDEKFLSSLKEFRKNLN